MVSSESIKSLILKARSDILEAKGDILILMQDVQDVDTEWAEEMWEAWDHLTFALVRLERADNPFVQIDIDRALDNGYPAICPLTENE